MLDVVVLPCVPVTAIVGRSRVSSPSSSARCSSLSPRSRATVRSGLSAGIALDTTTSAPGGTFAASCSRTSSPGVAEVRGVGRAVRAGDLGAERLRHPRQAAHPGSADADEVQLAARPWGCVGHGAGA